MPDYSHFIDSPMAALATDPAIHVHGVVEVSVVGSLVNANPLDRRACGPAIPDGQQFWIAPFDNGRCLGEAEVGMAIHACLRGRHIRVTGDFYVAMAVTAIHAELVHMDFMGEWHRLRGHVAYPGVFGSEVIPDSRHHKCCHSTATCNQNQRQPVHSSRKYVRHC